MRTLFLFIIVVFTATNVFASEQSFKYDDHGKRDPFWPLVDSSGIILNYDADFLISDISLEGIITGADGRNFAIINGKIVSQNDRIGQFVIDEIQKNTVVLMKSNKRYEIRLKKED